MYIAPKNKNNSRGEVYPTPSQTKSFWAALARVRVCVFVCVKV